MSAANSKIEERYSSGLILLILAHSIKENNRHVDLFLMAQNPPKTKENSGRYNYYRGYYPLHSCSDGIEREKICSELIEKFGESNPDVKV